MNNVYTIKNFNRPEIEVKLESDYFNHQFGEMFNEINRDPVNQEDTVELWIETGEDRQFKDELYTKLLTEARKVNYLAKRLETLPDDVQSTADISMLTELLSTYVFNNPQHVELKNLINDIVRLDLIESFYRSEELTVSAI